MAERLLVALETVPPPHPHPRQLRGLASGVELALSHGCPAGMVETALEAVRIAAARAGPATLRTLDIRSSVGKVRVYRPCPRFPTHEGLQGGFHTIFVGTRSRDLLYWMLVDGVPLPGDSRYFFSPKLAEG